MDGADGTNTEQEDGSAGGSYIEQADGSLKLSNRTEPALTKSEKAAAQADPIEQAPIAAKPASQAKAKKDNVE